MNPSAEIRDAVLRFYEAVATGDVSTLERLISRERGVLAIGSDPNEWWAGYDAIQQAFKAQFQETGARQVHPGDLNAFVEGTVGWAPTGVPCGWRVAKSSPFARPCSSIRKTASGNSCSFMPQLQCQTRS